jgi:hypothetical protein
MDIPFVDLKKPENIVRETFEDDRWIKDEFANYFAIEMLDFASALAPSFELFETLNKLATNVQTSLVAGFIHSALDDLLISVKLLMSGKMMASGNSMRQAIEGICIAIMCASGKPLKIHEEELMYWRCMEANDLRVMGHKAVKQVEINREILGVSKDAIDRLKGAKDHYDKFSHSGLMGLASRVSMGEVSVVYVGGAFDEAKLDAYRVEIKERIGLSRIIPQVIKSLIERSSNPG